MPANVAILEDNEDRQRAMLACLQVNFPQLEIGCFDSAAGIIGFLKEHLAETVVISLDHDLELKASRAIDPGTGREVADFLAGQAPVCPVVIHTSNSAAAVGMEMVLREAGWKTYRVVPCDDVAWIPTEWKKAIQRAIKKGR